MYQAKTPIPNSKLVSDEPVQRVTLANADNHSVAGRRLASAVEEPTIFMIILEIETVLRREKEKASISLICMDLKPPYSVEVVSRP